MTRRKKLGKFLTKKELSFIKNAKVQHEAWKESVEIMTNAIADKRIKSIIKMRDFWTKLCEKYDIALDGKHDIDLKTGEIRKTIEKEKKNE